MPRRDNTEADTLAKSKEPTKVLSQPSTELMCIATRGVSVDPKPEPEPDPNFRVRVRLGEEKT